MKDLTGDVLSDEIDVHTPGGLDEMEMLLWADRVANALYPHGTSMFSGGRWINSLEPVNEVALLMNVHGIFRRSVPIWLNKMKGKG